MHKTDLQKEAAGPGGGGWGKLGGVAVVEGAELWAAGQPHPRGFMALWS